MLSQYSIKKTNLILALVIVILSFYTIIWHHQNYLLYKQSRAVEMQNQQIVAMNKQLLSEHSEQINGFQIKAKALTILNMRPALTNKHREIKL